MPKKILIANRGEIAVRIIRTCKELGLGTVVIHSTADSGSLATKLADESICVGGPFSKDSYLNVPSIVSAATLTGCDAIHPGYGFLSEKPILPELCSQIGITFIGPSADSMRTLGDKEHAKKLARDLGLPTIPGSSDPVTDFNEALKEAEKIGFPILLKAAAGGGGRGMRVVRDLSGFEQEFRFAQQEVESAFSDNRILIEKFFPKAKHLEVQILGDLHGNYYALGLRECSAQRRFQKIIEEALPYRIEKSKQDLIAKDALKLAKHINYHSLGTVEFLYDCEQRKHYFLEVNTRVQVEHPVTEELFRLDLVRLQILAAFGEEIKLSKDQLQPRGHTIEARVNAEDSVNLLPQSGKVNFFHQPSGFGVRVDTFLFSDCFVPPYYDSLIAKVICWGEDRNIAISRLKRALEELVVSGIQTNQQLLLKMIEHESFISGEYDINFVNFIISES